MKKANTTKVRPTNISNTEWFEHFNELLINRPTVVDETFEVNVNDYNLNHDTNCINCTDNVPDMLNARIEIDEIVNVIKKLPNGKSAGIDGIGYEFFKSCTANVLQVVCSLFNSILSKGEFPSQWCDAIISPLHKKGSRNDPTNYRGISLMCRSQNL